MQQLWPYFYMCESRGNWLRKLGFIFLGRWPGHGWSGEMVEMTPVISGARGWVGRVGRGEVMKRAMILILVLAITTLAAARDKKTKAKPGPYVFSSKASAQTVKGVIVQANLNDGYTLDSDDELHFRFSRPAQMPLYGQIFMASNACPDMTTKQVWSYTLVELEGTTKVTVQPAWDYPDDYCKMQTNDVAWSKPEEMTAFQAMLDKAPAVVVQAPAPTATPAAHPQVVPREDAARRAQQHQACLDLAKDNPSITCK